jgi:hypothetical protein
LLGEETKEMVTVSIIISIVNLIALLFVLFLKSYASEKGKNLATKEDITIITDKVEGIKSKYETESQLIEMRRHLFEQVVDSLRVFITGHPSDTSSKDRFLVSYAKTWLWAPDSVVKSLNEFLHLQRQFVAKPGSVQQDNMKEAYAKCVIEMRKHAGFPDTDLSDKDYQFVQF